MVPTYRGRKDAWRVVDHASHRDGLEVVNGGILTTFSQPTSNGRSRALVSSFQRDRADSFQVGVKAAEVRS